MKVLMPTRVEQRQPCAICKKTACDCTSKLAPFQLYDHYKRACGAFADVALALNCMRLIDQSSNGPARLFDRHGLPVKI